MTRRFALVALWLAATVVAVLLATYAVRLAGDKVVAQGPATVSRSEVEAGLGAAPGSVAPAGSSAPATTAAPGAPSTPTDPATPSPATTATPSTSVAPASPVGPGSDDPAPPPTDAVVTVPPPAPIEQSFPLVGGSVRVRCVGDTASLVSSSPNPGYAMEVRATGPREVEVRFTGADHTSELKGSCVGGAVTAEPKESGGDGDGDGDGGGGMAMAVAATGRRPARRVSPGGRRARGADGPGPRPGRPTRAGRR